MTSAPDLLNLLCLDPRQSLSPFGQQHRTLLIAKDYTNSGDFVFNSLLQYFGRREPNTQILLVTLSHNWASYSASATRCGFNLRRTQNLGNIEVFDLMETFFEESKRGQANVDKYCDMIYERIASFVNNQTTSSLNDDHQPKKPIAIMIDDLSILPTIGVSPGQVLMMVVSIDKLLRKQSRVLPDGRANHLVVQTMFTNFKSAQTNRPCDDDLNHLISNLENMSDLSIYLKPLDTGHSTRVDGTIKVVDNRLPAKSPSPQKSSPQTHKLMLSMFPEVSGDIGAKKAYFYKLGDRRVRLTSSALIF